MSNLGRIFLLDAIERGYVDDLVEVNETFAVIIRPTRAIITYCLVAIVQHDMRLERSTHEALQILGISLTGKTHH